MTIQERESMNSPFGDRRPEKTLTIRTTSQTDTAPLRRSRRGPQPEDSSNTTSTRRQPPGQQLGARRRGKPGPQTPQLQHTQPDHPTRYHTEARSRLQQLWQELLQRQDRRWAKKKQATEARGHHQARRTTPQQQRQPKTKTRGGTKHPKMVEEIPQNPLRTHGQTGQI